MTNYYARIEKRGNNQHLVKALKAAGHTVIVVTNFPYRRGTTTEADAVICNFSGSPDSIRIAADLVFGAVKPYPTTKMPIDLSAEKNLPDQAPAPAPKKPAKKAGGKWTTRGAESARHDARVTHSESDSCRSATRRRNRNCDERARSETHWDRWQRHDGESALHQTRNTNNQ